MQPPHSYEFCVPSGHESKHQHLLSSVQSSSLATIAANYKCLHYKRVAEFKCLLFPSSSTRLTYAVCVLLFHLAANRVPAGWPATFTSLWMVVLGKFAVQISNKRASQLSNVFASSDGCAFIISLVAATAETETHKDTLLFDGLPIHQLRHLLHHLESMPSSPLTTNTSADSSGLGLPHPSNRTFTFGNTFLMRFSDFVLYPHRLLFYLRPVAEIDPLLDNRPEESLSVFAL